MMANIETVCSSNLKFETYKIKNSPIFLVEFSNGCLRSSKICDLKYSCYKSSLTNIPCNPKRMIVANSQRLCYTGSNFETDLSKITSSVLKVCIFNKKDSSFEFYDADIFHLKPLLKCSEIFQSKETGSYSEMSSDLTIAFGSKAKKKIINTNLKYSLASAGSSDFDDSIFIVPETFVDQAKDASNITENNTIAAIPPQNSAAVSVDEIYNLYDIISKEEYIALDLEAETFLAATYKDCEHWKKENKYSAFIIQYLENNVLSMNLHKAKLLCYLHYMFCFIRTVYTDWRKKDPVPGVPPPFKQKLMDSFTIKKSMPQRMKDKLLAYAIVLGLMLNNYIFHSKILASSTKIPIKRMVSVAYALGCHVSENKSDDTKIIELKLPLYKHQPIFKRKKN